MDNVGINNENVTKKIIYYPVFMFKTPYLSSLTNVWWKKKQGNEDL